MIITKVENNRVVKYLQGELTEELLERFPDAFEYEGDYSPRLWVEGQTISFQDIPIRKEEILGQIEALESGQYMTRGEREAWLVLTVFMGAQQGKTEAQIYAANPFYKKIKDQDNVIKALRETLP